MKVKNINGTSELDCTCGSWLEHWKNFSGADLSTYCYEKSCIKAPTLGAHVKKDSSTDTAWYIVPLCDSHNKKSESLELVDSAVLVSASVSHTCGKSSTAPLYGTGALYRRW